MRIPRDRFGNRETKPKPLHEKKLIKPGTIVSMRGKGGLGDIDLIHLEEVERALKQFKVFEPRENLIAAIKSTNAYSSGALNDDHVRHILRKL
ncbi:hypothetical protein HUU53_01535 [Candidatus Micrarchaeota archaeon]|nr:hypothetical protein [Candidatus Micrarchaeota archaeon]